VNYFLHTGHLHIEGLKMAKSLKNFITIGAALERYGARALRLLFLLYRYNAPMDYSDAVMDLVAGVERPFVEFFAKVKGALRSLSVDGRAKWGPREHEFAGSLEAAKEAVRAALADDFDTPVRAYSRHARCGGCVRAPLFSCGLEPRLCCGVLRHLWLPGCVCLPGPVRSFTTSRLLGLCGRCCIPIPPHLLLPVPPSLPIASTLPLPPPHLPIAAFPQSLRLPADRD
jgi:hypothetical protein